jgi:hypothetical protein
MTYTHRRWHAWLWLLLGPLVWAGFLAGALFRPAAEAEGAGHSDSRHDTRVELDPPSTRGPS